VLFDEKARTSITSDIFIPAKDQAGLGLLEAALADIHACAPARAKIDQAHKDGALDKGALTDMAQSALDQGIITGEEFQSIMQAEQIRNAVIQVADFSPEAYDCLK
jgi:hypothetical protein